MNKYIICCTQECKELGTTCLGHKSLLCHCLVPVWTRGTKALALLPLQNASSGTMLFSINVLGDSRWCCSSLSWLCWWLWLISAGLTNQGYLVWQSVMCEHRSQASPHNNKLYSKLEQNKDIIPEISHEKGMGISLKRKAKPNQIFFFFQWDS